MANGEEGAAGGAPQFGENGNGGNGGAFPGFGTGVAGPTAVGNAGTSTLARRSDQTGAAYRSDLPLSTTWFVDPVNGTDIRTNPGTTSATALKTLGEVRRRMWGAEITANTTITILGNLPSTDTGAWNVAIAPGITITLLGFLGATTGFGGAAINNTLFTGSVTAFTAASDTPGATDSEMTDSSIPVSFTASGLLAAGVFFQRTNSTAVGWYALKDLGAKNIRITPPMTTSGVNLSAALTVADTYKAYALYTIPNQRLGAYATQFLYQNLQDISVLESAPTNGVTRATVRTNCWMAGSPRFETMQRWTNCLIGVQLVIVASADGPDLPNLIGGGGRGTGATTCTISGPIALIQGAMCFQGMVLAQNTLGRLSIAKNIAFYDCTASCMQSTFNSEIDFTIGSPNGGGVNGIGNSGNLLSLTQGSTLYWGQNTQSPPFSAATTSVGSPISINGVGFTVAALPATTNQRLTSNNIFPYGPNPVASGAVASVMTANTGPTGVNANIQRWIQMTMPDGTLASWPSWT